MVLSSSATSRSTHNNNNNKNNGHQFIQQVPFRTDPAECSATGNLRDLRVLCGKRAPLEPWTIPDRAGRGLFTTEDTEVTEALGRTAAHTAGLGIRFDYFFVG